MASLRLSLFAFLTFISGTVIAGNLKVNLAPSQAVNAGARWRVDGGTWRTSGTTVNSLSNGAHTVDYNTVTGWFAPSPVTVTLTGGTTTITGTYAAPSSLKITLTPSTGQWRVDGGAWQNSGTTATGLAPGAHSISYNALANYTAPATENVTLVSGQTTTLTRAYTATSSLTITLTPPTGSWQIDGGPWQPGGGTLSGLTPGAHTVNYNALANHIAPVAESVTLVGGQTTSLTRTYTETSNLTITLTPSNGSWKVDGGVWQSSGATLSLTLGAHTISYAALANYTAPSNETVTLISGQNANLTRSYVATSNLTITLTPSNASWQIDGGARQSSGTTLSGLTPGAHTINYNALANYIAPTTESVTLVSGQSTNLSRTYTATSNLTITLTPASGSWRIDGGAWQLSGATLTQLTPGAHTISYNALANHITPATESVTLVSGQTTSLARTYTETTSLTINLTPSNGTWRLDGGAWQSSGATLPDLTLGAHTISYAALANYIAPSTETVTLVSGPGTTLTRSYTAPSNLTVTLTPSSGNWQIDGVGTWRASGATATGLTPGSHTIAYSNVSAMLSPDAETVVLISGETTSLARSYTPAGQLFVMLNPNTAQWRVDGGAWRATHTYSGWIAAGSHTIEYSAVPAMLTPAAQTVSVPEGQTVNISKVYAVEYALTVNLNPAVGQWRIDGGAWQNSGARVGQLTQGTHAVEYSDASGYFAPPAETIFVNATEMTVARTYVRPGAVTVNIVPAEGQWRLTNGEWQASGATLSGLRPGYHSIEFTSVPGWFDLPNFYAVTVVEDQTTTTTYTHVRHATITATLTPGAGQWRMNGGAWQPSGATVGALSSGNYTVDYSAIPGFTALPSETVALATGEQKSINRSYSGSSSLTVTLSPSSATWSVDGGPWRNSGTTASGLPPGAHTISYGTLANHLTPPSETVTLDLDEAASVTRSYTPAGQIVVTLSPGTAQWRVDGGEWRATGTSSGLIAAGSHTIGYSPLPNMLTPMPETVTLSAGQTLLISKTYTAESALTVNLTPTVGQWRIDGGAWQNSGTRVGQLAQGNHAVEYSAVPGYFAPGSETVTLNGTDMTITRSYLRYGALTVNVEPAQGQWRLLNGTWQASGATINYLRPGYYNIQFSSVPGYFDLPNYYTIFVEEGQTTTRTYTHVRHATITATLTPSAGLWRVNGGVWQSSGATVGALSSGNYVIDYSTIPGFAPLPSETITLAAGEQKSITRSYSGSSSLTVTLSPSSGSWSVDGGPWRNSGTTASGLSSGSHTISYQALANHLSPPTETVTLGLDENASLTRSYTAAGQIFVTLVPGTAQWRVDGGAWRESDTSSGLIAAGSHTIEYSTLANYIAPPIETVTVAVGQTLAISRTYTADFGATLVVNTIPAYLSEIGVVQWRLDGGSWNATGAPVSVSPGTHTLEFQPVAGLDVPPASSVTIGAGATETIEATFYLKHRLRFFLHPDLVAGISPEQLQARLSQYAAHLQTIWHRESLRRFTFNPATDISIVSTTPFSGSGIAPLPEYGFELWAYADSSNGSIYGSNGGFAILDVSGAAGADGMHWTQIYDPSTLAPGSTELSDYWKQIDAFTHELEHVFGAGFGEYYSAAGFDDATGIAPLYSVDYFAPADPFWNAHADFWSDPLLRYAWDNYRLGNPNTLPALLDAVHFSATSRGLINGCYRNTDTRSTLPDLARIRISVVDATSGQPISGATLRIWNRPNPSPTGGQELAVATTGTPGVFEFNWIGDSTLPPLNNWDNGKLLKAFASGYQPKAQWEWIYDAQRVKTVDNADVWEITVALDPAP
jgi:hypothetical protein